MAETFVWKEDQPIYRQITDILIARILDRTYAAGDMLPSVRQIAEEFDVSPITGAKVYQELDKEDVTVKRRGVGAFIKEGAREAVLERQRSQFLETEWPELKQRLKLMEISAKDLIATLDD